MQDLLEQVGADELVEYAFLIHGRLRTFHAFLYPLATLRFGDVHEFNADRATINLPRFASGFARDLQLGMRRFRQEAEWVEIGLEISPLAECIEHALTVSVGGIEKRRRRSSSSSLSSCHGPVLG